MKAKNKTPKNNVNIGNKANSNNNSKNAVATSEHKFDNRWFIPLVIAAAVVPLIIMAHQYNPGLQANTWFDRGHTQVDTCLFYKGVFLEITAVVILFIMCYMATKDRAFVNDKKSVSPMIAIGVFALMTLVSSLLSKHTGDAFFGGFEQFEGCFVVLSYAICFFMAFGYARSEDVIKFILNALMIGALIVSLIGVLQLMGADFFLTDLADNLVSLFEFREHKYDITVSAGSAFSTLYNSNYVGSYVPLVLPFSAYMTVCGSTITKKIIAGLTSVMLIIQLYGSGSEAGVVAAGAGVVVAFVLFLPRMKKTIRIVAVAVCGVALIGMAFVVVRGGFIERFFVAKESRTIENIKTDGYGVIITTEDGKQIHAELDEELLKTMGWSQNYPIEEKFTVRDERTGNILKTKGELVDDKKHIVIEEEGYPVLSFFVDVGEVSPENDPQGFGFLYDQFHVVSADTDEEREWIFSGEDDGTLRYCVGDTGKLSKLRNISREGFDGKYSFASGRGYIWACTIPRLTKYLLTGVGQDNFVYAFPNDDFVGRKNWGYASVIVNKPHNVFLQIWVQDGFIALLAFLFLYVLFIVRALRFSFGKHKSIAGRAFSAWGIVAMTAIGTTAYMIAGMANDSNVCVAPVFWVLLGIGYAAEAVCFKQAREAVPAEDAGEGELDKDQTEK